MRRVVGPRRLRRRLTVTFALVVAMATGALALGTYLVVRSSRLDASLESALEQARTNLVLAGTVLQRSSSTQDVSDLLVLYARRSGFETVALAGGEPFSTSLSLGALQIPEGVQALVRKGDLAYERVQVADQPYLVAGGRIPRAQAEFYFFSSEEAVHDDLAQLRTILLVGWGVVVALSAAAGAFVARRVLRPVAQASEAAHSLAEGLLETRLPIDADDEFGSWAASFNEMAEALEAKIRALSEAQARERRFTADVAHELRTPLTALAGEASLLAEQLERMPEEARRPAQLLVHDVDRLRRLVEELLEISRLDAGREVLRTEPVELGAFVRSLLRSRGWEASIRLDAEHVAVRTDPRRAERIVSNLIENALAHGGRNAAVRVGRHGADAFVEVSDRGPGILPDHLPHVFERFYKVDAARAGGGSGLGLAIAHENARLLGGRLEARSEVGEGARFTLSLPVAETLRSGSRAEGCRSHDGG